MRQANIAMLRDPLDILENGFYMKEGQKIKLKLSRKQMENISVYLPNDVKTISESKDASHVIYQGCRIGCGCVNMDSFSLARKRYKDCAYVFSKDEDPRILVLNLANPVNPGGGVRRGAKAQEEDLCRKSSLLISLESKNAQKYYEYNKALKSYMGSDAIIITPDAEDFFRRIDFAVMDHSLEQYNYKEFCRNFEDFYREENAAEIKEALDKIKKTEVHLDQIRGSLFGGAVGDALGYAIEFLPEGQIFSKYGKKGITEYVLDKASGKALISDDTQMSLFTANGLLVGETRLAMRDVGTWPRVYVERAYQDWLKTQNSSYSDVQRYERFTKEGGYSWLLDVPELFARRAPGNTC